MPTSALASVESTLVILMASHRDRCWCCTEACTAIHNRGNCHWKVKATALLGERHGVLKIMVAYVLRNHGVTYLLLQTSISSSSIQYTCNMAWRFCWPWVAVYEAEGFAGWS
ncbi:hypothetical protein DL95DRAFT_395657 [Leptodontidium sp. 2 PMI_412]|nr:hypothetical protein DL95DRAFT_395657 [Leptodontidium sp. 2 PMI_412]